MLQPGRFDVLVYLGVNDDKETRVKILKAQTRKMKLACSLDAVEALMPKGFTGADIYNYVSLAFRNALKKRKEEIQEEMFKGERVDRRTAKRVLSTLPKERLEVEITLDCFNNN